MQNETVSKRYATAVFALAGEAKRVAEVGRDLSAAHAALYGEDDVRRFYLSPVFQRADKERILGEAFKAKLDPIAFHTLLLLVRKRREALLPSIVEAYHQMALAASGKEPLEIVSARELAPSELDEIVARLSRTSGKNYEVTERVDPSLLGGIRITTAEVSVDGSIAARLDRLARDLSTTNATRK
jgi:F-type H+-transporting ATPase subunit delta